MLGLLGHQTSTGLDNRSAAGPRPKHVPPTLHGWLCFHYSWADDSLSLCFSAGSPAHHAPWMLPAHHSTGQTQQAGCIRGRRSLTPDDVKCKKGDMCWLVRSRTSWLVPGNFTVSCSCKGELKVGGASPCWLFMHELHLPRTHGLRASSAGEHAKSTCCMLVC